MYCHLVFNLLSFTKLVRPLSPVMLIVVLERRTTGLRYTGKLGYTYELRFLQRSSWPCTHPLWFFRRLVIIVLRSDRTSFDKISEIIGRNLWVRWSLLMRQRGWWNHGKHLQDESVWLWILRYEIILWQLSYKLASEDRGIG